MTLTHKEIETIKNFNEGAGEKLDHGEDWEIVWQHHEIPNGELKLSTVSDLCALALRGLDATETAQGALVILNVHKLEKAKAYDEGFSAGIEEAARDAERCGDMEVSAATIIREKRKPL